ncbi:MAG: hypothetical protein M0D57_01170 [Sphingobacteriales bacterium JAD_PAG50586_3]|nr:MAG: hypothetical protein M0D57_01170 [Sphingobacteriales bacterium JAD_PAG50586_3]
MKATIYSHKLKIGTAELKPGDVSMGHVYGVFSPNEDYYRDTQKQVWKINNSRGDWSTLRFNVQLENGCFLYAAGGITIDDMEDVPGEPLQIDVVGVDSWVLNDFFTENPRMFVEEPWEPLEIMQKISHEKELDLELGDTVKKERSFFDFFKSKPQPHILSGSEFFALCRHQGNDDVLFRIEKYGAESMVAVVHLTWIAKTERLHLGYPATTIYKDFDDFKFNRMRKDTVDWYE